MELNKIAKITMGQSPSSDSYNKVKDGLPFFQGNADFGIKYPVTRVWCSNPKKIAHKGDILISIRAPIGAINIANCECCIGRGLASIEVNEKKYNNDYVYTYLKASSKKLNQYGTGSTFKAINNSVLCNFDVPDLSYNEQSEFMMKVDCLSQILDSRREQLEKLDLLIRARFVEMFNSEAHLVCKLKDISKNIIAGGDKPKDIKKVATEEYKYPVFANGIEDDGLQGFSKHYRISESALTISARGSIGYCCVREDNFTPVVRLITVVPKESINLVYLKYYFSNLNFGATGTSQKQLTVPLVKDMTVLVPTMNEQSQFADFVTQVEKIKADVKKSLDKTQMLFDSLMQQYFE